MVPKTAYLLTSFFIRFYDMEKRTYTLHLVLHEVHGPDLLKHENIVIPVARPGHWACLLIDPTKRTIKYLDSYFQGGAEYTHAMRAYPTDFENIIGTKPLRPWTCIETTHQQSRENATHIYVPSQI